MGKSIRSKTKRKNRTEFRQTIGASVVEANRSTVQEKLQECINKGSMNCLDRISNLLSTEPLQAQVKITVEDSMDLSDVGGTGKRPNKLPVKAKTNKKHSVTKSPWQKASKKISSKSKRGRTRPRK
mmetsp:Transcript_29376/g.87100  ORF Transcript_29376/g.87100 Transcript_29376/m.87100 type:complete len:126 (-) Transcript_29376:2580-2957(-)